MRVLVVADLHYSLPQFDWLLREAENFALVVIAGDLLDLAGHAGLDAQITIVSKYLDRLRAKVPLIACSGNHDGDEKTESDEHVARWLIETGGDNLTVDGQSLEIDGNLFSVCPWWDGPETRAEMARFIEAESAKPRRRWIWIHHAPPADAPVCWTGGKHAGDTGLNELIARHKPDLVLSGHIHNSPFFPPEGSWIARVGQAWTFNPGHIQSDEPPHIILDLKANTARWVSYGDPHDSPEFAESFRAPGA